MSISKQTLRNLHLSDAEMFEKSKYVLYFK